MFDYVPTELELDHIRFLRGEMSWADRKLQEARQALADYEQAIRDKAELANLRGVTPASTR